MTLTLTRSPGPPDWPAPTGPGDPSDPPPPAAGPGPSLAELIMPAVVAAWERLAARAAARHVERSAGGAPPYYCSKCGSGPHWNHGSCYCGGDYATGGELNIDDAAWAMMQRRRAALTNDRGRN